MVTWTTYGTWLQGDKRGYVKNGIIYRGNEKFQSANRTLQKSPVVKLNSLQKQIVENAITKGAEKLGDKILAIAVCSNHVHILFGASTVSIDKIVHRYKYAATRALGAGRIWSKGFDKRYCFTDDEVTVKIKYINTHNKKIR